MVSFAKLGVSEEICLLVLSVYMLFKDFAHIGCVRFLGSKV
jgi:hypothetical protein